MLPFSREVAIAPPNPFAVIRGAYFLYYPHGWRMKESHGQNLKNDLDTLRICLPVWVAIVVRNEPMEWHLKQGTATSAV
jgi:hypothetical protein